MWFWCAIFRTIFITLIDSLTPRTHRVVWLWSTHGTPGTMTPILARKTVAFYDSDTLRGRVITKAVVSSAYWWSSPWIWQSGNNSHRSYCNLLSLNMFIIYVCADFFSFRTNNLLRCFLISCPDQNINISNIYKITFPYQMKSSVTMYLRIVAQGRRWHIYTALRTVWTGITTFSAFCLRPGCRLKSIAKNSRLKLTLKTAYTTGLQALFTKTSNWTMRTNEVIACVYCDWLKSRYM